MPEHVNTLAPPFTEVVKSKLDKYLLVATALLYGVLLLFLSLQAPPRIYNSPDETANVFFAKGIAEDGHLIRTPTYTERPSSVTPRSMLRSEKGFVPVGFVSFPLLEGGIVALVKERGLQIVVAFLGMLMILAWYGLLRPLLGEKLSLLSSFILAIHPLFLYWGARVWLPNIFFMSCCVFGSYFLSRAMRTTFRTLPNDTNLTLEHPTATQPRATRFLHSILGGLLFGIAISLRLQEGMWLIAFIVFFIIWRRYRSVVGLVAFWSATLLPVIGLLFLQGRLYGNPLQTGYHISPVGRSFLGMIRVVILPFGFNGSTVVSVLSHYLVQIQWWFFFLAALGIVAVIIKRGASLYRNLKVIAALLGMLTLWFLIFYGSFSVSDRVDGMPSIGTSFTRYFLPLYLIASPLIAYALYLVKRYGGMYITAACIMLGVVTSLQAVFWKSDESLISIIRALKESREIKEHLLRAVPENGIVLTDRSDKLLFPERDVVTRFRNFHQPDFVALYPFNLYYETIASPEVVRFEQTGFWGPHGLNAIDPVDLGYRHTLYRLDMVKSKILNKYE